METATSLMSKEFLTVHECASLLKVSRDSIIRWFENRPGVLSIGNDETRFKRRYKTLRIPREVLEGFIVENRVQ
jgi:hypothetical protein